MTRLRPRLRQLLPALALVAAAPGCSGVIAGTEPWEPPRYWAAERFTQLEGLDICYLDEGPRDAETIVFIHGWSGNVQNWWDQFEHFEDRYRVVVFDAPGHGKSSRGDIDYSMALHMAVLDGLLDELEIERAIVVGNSGGGWIATNYAIQHPERVTGLVIADSTGTRHKGSAGAVLELMNARWLQISNMTTGEHYPGQDAKSRARQAFVASFAGTVEEAPYLEALAALLAPAYEVIANDALAKIEAPTLIVWGDDDPVVPINAMKIFDRHIADSQTYVVHLGGHSPMMQSPDEFNCAMDVFLSGGDFAGCKQYALTPQRRADRLAGRDWGPHYARRGAATSAQPRPSPSLATSEAAAAESAPLGP